MAINDRLQWRQLAAPDFTPVARIREGASRDLSNAFDSAIATIDGIQSNRTNTANAEAYANAMRYVDPQQRMLAQQHGYLFGGVDPRRMSMDAMSKIANEMPGVITNFDNNRKLQEEVAYTNFLNANNTDIVDMSTMAADGGVPDRYSVNKLDGVNGALAMRLTDELGDMATTGNANRSATYRQNETERLGQIDQDVNRNMATLERNMGNVEDARAALNEMAYDTENKTMRMDSQVYAATLKRINDRFGVKSIYNVDTNSSYGGNAGGSGGGSGSGGNGGGNSQGAGGGFSGNTGSDIDTVDVLGQTRWGQTASNIPFKETRDYVQKITSRMGSVSGSPEEKATQIMEHLIWQESRGNNKAVSPKGARGITPETAKNPGLGVKPLQNESQEEYYRFGKDYLTALLKRYNGNVDAALAAYNGGLGNADEWYGIGSKGGTVSGAYVDPRQDRMNTDLARASLQMDAAQTDQNGLSPNMAEMLTRATDSNSAANYLTSEEGPLKGYPTHEVAALIDQVYDAEPSGEKAPGIHKMNYATAAGIVQRHIRRSTGLGRQLWNSATGSTGGNYLRDSFKADVDNYYSGGMQSTSMAYQDTMGRQAKLTELETQHQQLLGRKADIARRYAGVNSASGAAEMRRINDSIEQNRQMLRTITTDQRDVVNGRVPAEPPRGPFDFTDEDFQSTAPDALRRNSAQSKAISAQRADLEKALANWTKEHGDGVEMATVRGQPLPVGSSVPEEAKRERAELVAQLGDIKVRQLRHSQLLKAQADRATGKGNGAATALDKWKNRN